MGLLSKATEKKPATTTAKSKGTSWNVENAPVEGPLSNQKVAAALNKFITTKEAIDKLEAEITPAKDLLKRFGTAKMIETMAQTGMQPETPIKINNARNSITFVAQDRSSQIQIKDDQRDALIDLLGEDKANAIIYTQNTYKLDPVVLAIPGVFDAVEEALGAAVEKLIGEGKLTQEQADALVDGSTSQNLRPGTIARVAQPDICGQDQAAITAFFDIIDTICTRYPKA